MTGPDGGEGTLTARGVDVTDESDGDDRRALEHGDGLDNILLIELGTRLGDGADDVGHTGLEAHEGGEVAVLGGIIPREGFQLTGVVLGALLRQETEVSVTRALELTMRHCAIVWR